MKLSTLWIGLFFSLWVSALGFSTHDVSAHGYKRKTIEIVHPWTAQTGEADGRDAIVRMDIKNAGRSPERLLRAESAVAERVELHDAKGIALSDGLVIKGSSHHELKKDGVHLRMIGLKKGLVPYDTLPVTLVFERVGRIAIDVLVEEANN